MSCGRKNNNDLFRWECPDAIPGAKLKPQLKALEGYVTTQLLYKDESGGGIWFYVEHHAIHTRAGYLVKRHGKDEIFQQLQYAVDYYNSI